jgi:hypothetical protein
LNKAAALLLCLLVLLPCAPAKGADAKPACQAPGKRAPSFEFKDQYGSAATLEDFKGLPLALVYGDRASGERSTALGKSLNARYNTGPDGKALQRLRIVPVAHLGAVPEPLRGAALKIILELSKKKNLPPLLLDWDALLEKQYGYTPETTNVYIVDGEGRLAACAALVKKQDYDTLFRKLDALVPPPKK